MVLEDIAQVRTGLVTARKKASGNDGFFREYQLLNLKCILEPGYLDLRLAEPYLANDNVNQDCITKEGDILVRLSSPYTSVIISENECGYLVPSHFAIIRVDRSKADPAYVLWTLRKDSTRRKIEQNNSGSSAFGTISSGFFSNLKIRGLPLKEQTTIGQLHLLSGKEQQLLRSLAEEKEKYNRAIISMAYDSFKRGNNV